MTTNKSDKSSEDDYQLCKPGKPGLNDLDYDVPRRCTGCPDCKPDVCERAKAKLDRVLADVELIDGHKRECLSMTHVGSDGDPCACDCKPEQPSEASVGPCDHVPPPPLSDEAKDFILSVRRSTEDELGRRCREYDAALREAEAKSGQRIKQLELGYDELKRTCGGQRRRAEKAEAELAEAKKLLDPAVLRAVRTLDWNEGQHPGGCCGKCTAALAEVGRLTKVVGDYIALTRLLDEHPEAWGDQQWCECKLCLSYCDE